MIWRGYEHPAAGLARFQLIIYSIELTAEKAAELWERFKQWEGSQKDFYFRFVNPFKLCAWPKDPTATIRTPIKTARKK